MDNGTYDPHNVEDCNLADTNGDGITEPHETFECLVKEEKKWMFDNCPYGMTKLVCPPYVTSEDAKVNAELCPAAFDCDELKV